MNVKKIKRICGVRGCKNTEVYALSKTREMGNSVISCKDCLIDALKSIDNYVEPEKVKTERKPLFYHPELAVTTSSVADNKEPELKEVIEKVTEEAPISVTEDSVTLPKEEKPTIKPKTTTNNKKKPNKR